MDGKNEVPTTVPHFRRFHGFDLIRLLSMMAIVTFHSNETVFFTDASPMVNGTIYPWLQAVAKHLVFSGFTVVALSSFLYAVREPPAQTWYRLFALLTGGIFVLAWLAGDAGAFSFFFEWDVYGYLLVTLATLFAIRKSRALVRVFGVVGFGLLWIPIWNLIPVSVSEDRFWFRALVGVCDTKGGGGWPLLPWSGLMWMFYALGREWILNERRRADFEAGIGRAEGVVWLLILGISIPFLGGYATMPWGGGFGCYVYRKPPLVFWGHFIWVVALMRVSVVTGVNDALSRLTAVKWISRLEWSRHFGRCYLLHLIFLGVGSAFASFYVEHPWAFDIYVLGNIPFCEMISRVMNHVARKMRA